MADWNEVRQQIVALWRAHFAKVTAPIKEGQPNNRLLSVSSVEFETSRAETEAQAKALAEAHGFGNDRALLRVTTHDLWPEIVGKEPPPPPSPFAGPDPAVVEACDNLLGRLYNWKFTSALRYLEAIERAGPGTLRPEIAAIIRHLAEEYGNIGWTDGQASDIMFSMNRIIALDPRFLRIFDDANIEQALIDVARYAENPAFAARLTDADRAALAAAGLPRPPQ